MSAKGTATENLAKWLEIQLKPYGTMHEAFIKDSKSVSLHLEHLSDTRAPFNPIDAGGSGIRPPKVFPS